MNKSAFLVGPHPINFSDKMKKLPTPELVCFIDGGLDHKPQIEGHFNPINSLSVGDGDSYRGEETFDHAYPTQKGSSDFALSLKHLDSLLGNIKNLTLLGLWGERLDHQMAIFGECLSHLNERSSLVINFYDQNFVKKAIAFNKQLEITHVGGFSLLTIKKNNISITGAATYLAQNLEILPLSSRTISNEANGRVLIKSEKPLLIFLN